MEQFPVNFFVCTKEFYEFVLIILRTKQEFDKKNRKKKTIMFARLSLHRLMTDRVLISGFSFFFMIRLQRKCLLENHHWL